MKYWKNGEIEIAETIMETLGLTTEQEKVMRRTLANLDDVLNDSRTPPLNGKDREMFMLLDEASMQLGCYCNSPSMKVKNWEGSLIQKPGPDDMVKVWKIDNHRDPTYTDCVIMGWQDMLEEVGLLIESKLENMEEADLKLGLGITVKLTEMRYSDYEDCLTSTERDR